MGKEAGGSYRILLVRRSERDREVERHVARLLDEQKNLIGEAIVRLYPQELTPESTFQFEQELEAAGNELMRVLLDWTLNQSECDSRVASKISQ